MEEPAMPVAPVHHRGDGEYFFAGNGLISHNIPKLHQITALVRHRILAIVYHG
jgi:hypothetical protein